MKSYKEKVNRDVLKYSFRNRIKDQWNDLPCLYINTFYSAYSINMFK